MEKINFFNYLKDRVSFESYKAALLRQVYLPLSGTTAQSLKSVITPYFSGDSKLDKLRYLTKPTSREDLRYKTRDFFFRFDTGKVIALTDKQIDTKVSCGQLWQKVNKRFSKEGLAIETLNFIPASGEDVEIMQITVSNRAKKKVCFSPISSIPLFARSLANKHDHEHVTSLLHRTEQLSQGVLVSPSMTFNEEGHNNNTSRYFVFGIDNQGSLPIGSFPTFDSFFGEEGDFSEPQAVIHNTIPEILSDSELNGKESVGALRFKDCELKGGEGISYILVMGIVDDKTSPVELFEHFNTRDKVAKALNFTEKYWHKASSAMSFETNDENFDSWMRWVTIQPVLRRIFGCSFLPDHDYGKGGQGWRDIWQDLLALILIEPENIRQTLIDNYAGVRIDGSNATIIGSNPGEFIADRNSISRVWMDHGFWPLLTTLLYIDQTGDFDILFEESTYFYDSQLSRNFRRDDDWTEKEDNVLKDKEGMVYKGSILEHIFIQNLVPFFNVGDHNIMRLESADWNDGLDMAFDHGESVAFSSAYCGNLRSLIDLLGTLKTEKNIESINLCKELGLLLDYVSNNSVDYNNIEEKKRYLFDNYFKSVEPRLTGDRISIKLEDIITDLTHKHEWLSHHISKQEKITHEDNIWFNGYYDNKGEVVEGGKDNNVRMTLTAQVFPIMSGVATRTDIPLLTKSVRKYLKDPIRGGYRLNSDFKISQYLDLGRAFGFAFGTKENGAFFSHMTVMYAYALYKRGFAHEGFDVLNSIYSMATDNLCAKIYPGIPEYFNSEGQGMYHYLTGSASWFVLTLLTQVFGIRGENGDLRIEPMLLKRQFSESLKASTHFQFASNKVCVIYTNKKSLDFGEYTIKAITLNNEDIRCDKQKNTFLLSRDLVKKANNPLTITVDLA